MNQVVLESLELPASVREGLALCCEQMREAFGERLVSVILYGSLIEGEYSPTTSDVNVMLVLKEVTVEVLEPAVMPVQQGVREFRLAVMVVTEEDLHRSADVFPTKFLDMQRRHRLLWGKDVLADLPIARDHLRLRCEQEIKNLLLRLRQFYLLRAHRPEMIEATVAHSISLLLASLETLLLLQTGAAPAGKAAVAEAAAREFGLDEKTLQDALALKHGEYQPDANGLKQLYDEFMAAVGAAAMVVDQFPEE